MASSRLTDEGVESHLRAVALILERYACGMWEVGLRVSDFAIAHLRYQVEAESVRDEALASLSSFVEEGTGGKVCVEAAHFLDLRDRPVVVAGVSLSRLQVSVREVGDPFRHVMHLDVQEDVGLLVERYPTLNWAKPSGKGSVVLALSPSLAVIFENARRND